MEVDGFQVLSKDVQLHQNSQLAQHQHVTFWLTRQGSATLLHSGTIGSGQFNPALENILLAMRKGQKWTLANNGIKYTVQIFEAGLTTKSKGHLETADALKSEGNAFVKSKQYALAIQRYQQAYDLVVNDPSVKALQLKLSLISNLALVTLNSSELSASLKWCDEHLQSTLEPNVKVLYRRANANRGLRNWAEARRDIQQGIICSIGDEESAKNFRQLQQQLQREQLDQQKRQKVVYGKMFG